jgi:hypothetical protein
MKSLSDHSDVCSPLVSQRKQYTAAIVQCTAFPNPFLLL